ncbi:AraC family transcriptional regulator [Pseudoduganella sp. SL102]|uniref:AraC family transcriptional regulator n=1 Tax=Pseudoduganella sp. SL102 TaxID=2995154 RepID=UPI00248BB002|nr:AraC family transcriptional regulator [Pseudoduganella sp. SL102]WBS00358.1 AraC family transcriptional regulator [Pseudoduganella sp. SL102]
MATGSTSSTSFTGLTGLNRSASPAGNTSATGASDTLSDVLRTVRLRGAVFYAVNVGPEWAVEAPASAEVAAMVVPGAGRVIEYHVLIEGTAWASLPGQPPVRLAPGDVVMFPQGDAHVMASAPGVPPLPFSMDWMRATHDLPKPLPLAIHGNDLAWGDAARRTDGRSDIVCGFLGCDHGPFNPLLEALPRLLHVPADGDGAWLRQAMLQAACGVCGPGGGPGGGALAERISETMFIDAVRRHASRLPDHATGWLAGLRDRQVGRALALIHADPGHPWNVAQLAGAAALSRSAFCERFARLLGVSPARYLARWRMELAATLLRQGQAPVASIAFQVGYESEAAFTRAFARLVGMPPSRWRATPLQ